MAETSGEIDVSRRTWLAAERTWLAWWRTGVSVGAVAIVVGRFLPGVTKGPRAVALTIGATVVVAAAA